MSEKEPPGFDQVSASEAILVELRKRRQILLLREAKQGDSTDASVIREIEELTTRIIAQEAEVKRLGTQAAVDKWSFAEAMYRELLADTWDTDRGLPTTVGLERLERTRLELGIKPERAHELERDIRARLAREAFYSIDRWLLAKMHGVLFDISTSSWFQGIGNDVNAASLVLLQQLGRAIRFDVLLT